MKFPSALLFILLSLGTVCAQMDPNMNMGATPSASKFMQDMNVGMKKMDHGMASAPMTGDVDHDFVAMMIPHHQGAIDMAKGELAYGKDPEIRALAQKIIDAQNQEIAFMNRWLKKHAAAAAAP